MTESASNTPQFMMGCLLGCILFILLALLASRINLKKEIRSRQLLMPLIALIYGIVSVVIIITCSDLILALLNGFLNLLTTLHINPGAIRDFLLNTAATTRVGLLASLCTGLAGLINSLIIFFSSIGNTLLVFIVVNFGLLLLYMLIKGIAIRIMKRTFAGEGTFLDSVAQFFYEWDEEGEHCYLRKNCVQTRTFLKVMNYTVMIGMPLLAVLSCLLYHYDIMSVPLSPVVAVILVGELAYALDGLTKEEQKGSLEGEEERARHNTAYYLMTDVLRNLFPDKLSSESTSGAGNLLEAAPQAGILNLPEEDKNDVLANYDRFLTHQKSRGANLDAAFVDAGKELLEGRSVLFNHPFYYDLIPCVFYPMNRLLLQHKKVLVVLGRLGIEQELKDWCLEGLTAVTNTPTLWNVGIVREEEQDLDVGILTRSMVHDIAFHEANQDFLSQIGMMVLIEPSRLLTTAQIGLNSLIRYSGQQEQRPVFVSVDKNCDGLLDALSHVLMVSLTEVSATEHSKGTVSYMCWDADSDHLQHRMLPNISRYLGFGTELSIAALKNQISDTWWYSGDTFPVVDIRWIAGQYYYDLLSYASLPAEQEVLDQKFHVTSEMWGARKKPYQYITVEDEDNNLFEIKRDFATRSEEEGFINVLSPEYMMKDYMTQNEGIFNTDPKAIPYMVADYAHTVRNVVLRLCLRMSVGMIWESELRQELLLIEVDVENLQDSLWQQICSTLSFGGESNGVTLTTVDLGKEYRFTRDVIRSKRKYNSKTRDMESGYYITNRDFIRLYMNALQNTEYIAEDETDQSQYLGSEIMGQIYQRHLPGQFLTIAGKYYEFLRVNSRGKVILRRASEHITGRESYRQVREYTLENVKTSDLMGNVKEWDGLQVSVCYADITVRTPAYWKMDRYNDFTTAHRISVNGVPARAYYNKEILKIAFEGTKMNVTPEICRTLVTLMNELFVTLFAENAAYIVAVTPGEQKIPVTYTVQSSPEDENCIYIIEDCQMDIGLIETVERNLDRIYSILCDYLDWELEAEEVSRNPEPVQEEQKEVVQLPPPSDEPPADERKKKGFHPIQRIREWFRRRRKKKNKDTGKEEPVYMAEPETTEEPEAAEEPAPAKEPAAEESEMVKPEETKKSPIPERKPYYERYYLLYGGEEMPEGIQPKETLEFLQDRGYGNGELKQARKGGNLSLMIEEDYQPNLKGKHYCDFCGAMLTGTDYETLADGRERCMECGRTAIKTEQEFADLYATVHELMESLFGIRLDVPVAVKMVSTKKLSKELGDSFVPTGNYDARTIGVAISSKDGYSLLIENGSPRITAAMTMAHEMTHIWQYLNWDQNEIDEMYGRNNELLVYEGMAKWVEIQFAYLIGETASARREEVITRQRDDEYGQGFLIYESQYPISEGTTLKGDTPFKKEPLERK